MGLPDVGYSRNVLYDDLGLPDVGYSRNVLYDEDYVALTLYVLDGGKLVHKQWCQSQVAKVTEWLRNTIVDF